MYEISGSVLPLDRTHVFESHLPVSSMDEFVVAGLACEECFATMSLFIMQNTGE